MEIWTRWKESSHVLHTMSEEQLHSQTTLGKPVDDKRAPWNTLGIKQLGQSWVSTPTKFLAAFDVKQFKNLEEHALTLVCPYHLFPEEQEEQNPHTQNLKDKNQQPRTCINQILRGESHLSTNPSHPFKGI